MHPPCGVCELFITLLQVPHIQLKTLWLLDLTPTQENLETMKNLWHKNMVCKAELKILWWYAVGWQLIWQHLQNHFYPFLICLGFTLLSAGFQWLDMSLLCKSSFCNINTIKETQLQSCSKVCSYLGICKKSTIKRFTLSKSPYSQLAFQSKHETNATILHVTWAHF